VQTDNFKWVRNDISIKLYLHLTELFNYCKLTIFYCHYYAVFSNMLHEKATLKLCSLFKELFIVSFRFILKSPPSSLFKNIAKQILGCI
jgi:hypothetical protein